MAQSTDNRLAIEVFRHIADEERVHTDEFLLLLHELAPDEEKLHNDTHAAALRFTAPFQTTAG
jgi:rubrerythrin